MPELLEYFPDADCLEQRSSFRRKLLRWFDTNQRDLPWRRNKNRYRIWVSEIMLQQTQVKTVINYYRRFIKRFPSVKALAESNIDDVLKQWEGLGYYRRARQMHRAAAIIMTTHQGKFPGKYEDVIKLPGIGRYTAGAILSIADDQRLPILEGNTLRLFSRLLLLSTDPRSSENQKWLWEFSQTLLPRKRSGDFNQGLMELGALVCTPNAPNCKECPVKSHCPTLTHNMQTKIPAQGKKTDYQTIHEAVVLVARQKKFLVRKCLPNERWAGLWDFPRYCLDSPTDLPQQSCATLQQQICEDYGLEATIVSMNHTLRHAVTRYRIRLNCYQTKRVRGRLRQDRESRWVSPDELHALPMSATGRKVVNQLIR